MVKYIFFGDVALQCWPLCKWKGRHVREVEEEEKKEEEEVVEVVVTGALFKTEGGVLGEKRGEQWLVKRWLICHERTSVCVVRGRESCLDGVVVSGSKAMWWKEEALYFFLLLVGKGKIVL